VLSKSDFNPQLYRDAMARFAGAVHVVTTDGRRAARHDRDRRLLGVGQPPTMLVCINRENQSNHAFSDNGNFALNTLGEQHQELANGFSGLTGLAQEERFALGHWTTLTTGAPVLADSVATFDCELIEYADMATHRVLYGKVTGVRIGDSFAPLIYFNRSYRVL
jgi:cob(II)yrinic acid a,c-diamide reductase